MCAKDYCTGSNIFHKQNKLPQVLSILLTGPWLQIFDKQVHQAQQIWQAAQAYAAPRNRSTPKAPAIEHQWYHDTSFGSIPSLGALHNFSGLKEKEIKNNR